MIACEQAVSEVSLVYNNFDALRTSFIWGTVIWRTLEIQTSL